MTLEQAVTIVKDSNECGRRLDERLCDGYAKMHEPCYKCKLFHSGSVIDKANETLANEYVKLIKEK